MLKREITYDNFNDEKVTEVLYFNISQPDLVELEAEHPEGLSGWMQKVIDAKDNQTLVAFFKRIILLGYGERSEDGKYFVKNEEIRDKFSHTAAYLALYTELLQNEKVASDFLVGILPKEVAQEMAKAKDTKDIAELNTPPVPPTPPTS